MKHNYFFHFFNLQRQEFPEGGGRLLALRVAHLAERGAFAAEDLGVWCKSCNSNNSTELGKKTSLNIGVYVRYG